MIIIFVESLCCIFAEYRTEFTVKHTVPSVPSITVLRACYSQQYRMVLASTVRTEIHQEHDWKSS